MLTKTFTASVLACLGLFVAGATMAETIQMTIDGKHYPIELAENPDARNFAARLPMTLTFENFGSKERIAYPKPAIKVENTVRHFDIPQGTMTIYKPWGNIAVFLVDFPWNDDLTNLGKLTDEGLEALRTSGDKPVTFSQ